MKFLVNEMGTWHFWVVSCWPVLLRLCSLLLPESAGTYEPTPEHLAPWEKLLVLQIWYSCLQYLVLLKALWGPLYCHLPILVIEIVCSCELAQRGQIEKTKAMCNSCWGREWDGPAPPGWSCSLVAVRSSASFEEMALGRHLAQATFSLLLSPCSLGMWFCSNLWNTEQSVFCLCVADSGGSKAGTHSSGDGPVLGKSHKRIFNKPRIAGLECCRHVKAWKV